LQTEHSICQDRLYHDSDNVRPFSAEQTQISSSQLTDNLGN